MLRPLEFGSLFAGVGGIDLGLERSGWKCAWQVERDEFCQRVLANHWPDVPRHGDICNLTGAELAPVDLVCGGFPCQPVSVAGQRRGADDERWLWPEFARLLRVLRPRYALLENVPGLLAGDLFGQVLGDLAELGFDAEWACIPASAVGAPHLRYRVFVVAHRDGLRREILRGGGLLDGERTAFGDDADGRCGAAALADAKCSRPQGHGSERGLQAGSGSVKAGGRGDDEDAMGDTNCSSSDARSPLSGPWQATWWLVEPDVGRVAHGVPARVDRLRSLGNAVVPQVAEWVGRRLMDWIDEEERRT